MLIYQIPLSQKPELGVKGQPEKHAFCQQQNMV